MRWVGIVVGLAILGALAFAILHFGVLERSVVSSDLDTPLTTEARGKLAAKGRYLVVAADCYACHTYRDGPPWAGGLPFDTPFGTIHATNISPDPENGIGKWTRRDFHRALRDGIAPGGRHLYPAMPYASYRDLTAEDVDAMYAYLTTREPIARANVPNDLHFPMNFRALVGAWNIVALRAPEQPDAAKSAAWNRGRYLTDALGHCGECHTPRNFMMVMERDRYLKGAVIEAVEAPDITRDALAMVGFEPEGSRALHAPRAIAGRSDDGPDVRCRAFLDAISERGRSRRAGDLPAGRAATAGQADRAGHGQCEDQRVGPTNIFRALRRLPRTRGPGLAARLGAVAHQFVAAAAEPARIPDAGHARHHRTGFPRAGAHAGDARFRCHPQRSGNRRPRHMDARDLGRASDRSDCSGSRAPPVDMVAGDIVEVTIEGIGALRNPVVAER